MPMRPCRRAGLWSGCHRWGAGWFGGGRRRRGAPVRVSEGRSGPRFGRPWFGWLGQHGSVSLGTSGNFRAGRAGRVGGFELIGDGVANGVGPFAASAAVHPTFGKVTFGVVAVGQVICTVRSR